MKLPTAFGKYLLTDLIATGGMAEVFKAKSFGVAGFEKIVAIKKIHPHLALDQEFVRMFIDEARIASNLSHPNIVQIFDLGKIENDYFIAMEYVNGITLEQFMKADLSENERILLSCYIVREVSNALSYAHSKKTEDGTPLNIIHRDISPQNILISEEGIVKLTDFGVAKARMRLSKTESGMTKGKYPYMSPEQVEGKPVDSRSDIFSLCSVFYEILTQTPAFEGKTEYEILEAIKECRYRLPREKKSSIPREIENIIIRGLQKKTSQRYRNAQELSDRLSEYLLKNNIFEPQKRLKELINSEKVATQATNHSRKEMISTMVIRPKGSHGLRKILLLAVFGCFLIFTIFLYKRTENKGIMITTIPSIEQGTSNPIPTTPSKPEEEPSPEKKLVRVNLNTVPWSYVYLDGKKIGETPIRNFSLQSGEYTFSFINPLLKIKVTRTIKIPLVEEFTIFEKINPQQ